MTTYLQIRSYGSARIFAYFTVEGVRRSRCDMRCTRLNLTIRGLQRSRDQGMGENAQGRSR